jgi:hypothetical protein
MKNEDFVRMVREAKTAKVSQSDSLNMATKHEVQIFIEDESKWKTVFSTFDLAEAKKVLSTRKDKRLSNANYAELLRKPLPEKSVKRRP